MKTPRDVEGDLATEELVDPTGAPPTPGVTAPRDVVGRSPWETLLATVPQGPLGDRRHRHRRHHAHCWRSRRRSSRRSSRHGPNDVDLSALDEFGLPSGPSTEYWFGVDKTGRDLFVRVLYGARTSLVIAFFATGIALVIGVILGMTGRLLPRQGRHLDLPDDRRGAVAAGAAAGAGAGVGVRRQRGGVPRRADQAGIDAGQPIIGLFSWPYIARIIRGQVLSLREKEFIEASRSLGSSNRRIMLREILPNVAAPIIVFTTLIIPSNILFEAALSFLGVGVPDSTPSWGAMLADAGDAFTYAAWLMIFPGHRALPDDPRLQPGGRRSAGRPRSPDVRLTVSSEGRQRDEGRRARDDARSDRSQER